MGNQLLQRLQKNKSLKRLFKIRTAVFKNAAVFLSIECVVSLLHSFHSYVKTARIIRKNNFCLPSCHLLRDGTAFERLDFVK
jgi:hypothetical protein